MSFVAVRLEGLGEARKRIRGIPGIVFSATKRAFLKEARHVQMIARALAPKRTGELRQGIKVESEGGVTYGQMTVSVVSTADHGAFVEYGTGRRGASRNRAPLPPGYTYHPRQAGMFPVPHLLPAWRQRESKVPRTVANEVKAALRVKAAR